MLDSQKQSLLALVRAALTGEKQVLPADFCLEDAYETIIKHNIVVMALEGALKCGLPKGDPTVAKLFRLAFRAIGIVEAQDKAATALFAALEDAKIDFMPIKGAVLRELYPKPEYRSMGDMDVLIRLEQYPQIREIMLELGFEEKYESSYELVWDAPGLHLELHKRLIPSYNGDFYEYYGDGWQLAKSGEAGRREMTDEDHFVYVFAHMARHYRDGGVGIRQMCDIWLLRQKCLNMNEGYIHVELEKMGLEKFYKYVLQTLDVWFGDGESNDRTDLITEIVFASGCFGGERRILARGLRVQKDKEATGRVRYKHMLMHILLPYAEMKEKYPVLRKTPVLLPVMWVYRIVYIVLKEPFKVRRQYNKFQTYKKDNLDGYKDALTFVGLEYTQMEIGENGFV